MKRFLAILLIVTLALSASVMMACNDKPEDTTAATTTVDPGENPGGPEGPDDPPVSGTTTGTPAEPENPPIENEDWTKPY